VQGLLLQAEPNARGQLPSGLRQFPLDALELTDLPGLEGHPCRVGVSVTVASGRRVDSCRQQPASSSEMKFMFN
jgi:hypothetical protein